MLNRMAARFTRVLELDLSQSVSRSFYPGVTDSDLAVILGGFKCLKVLKLQNCKAITDKGLALIGSSLPSLQSLDASYCRKLSDKGLSFVAEGCHDMRSLHLAGCRFVTGGLLYLDINKCSNVGDIGVSKVAEACSSPLKALKLLDCYKVGDESIFSLSKFCKNLETLIIGGCRSVSDESIKSLAAACKNSLKNLLLDWCLNISNSSLRCILTQCKNLVALDIGCCEEVTDAAFESQGNEEIEFRLKVLKVSNCPKITVSGIGMLLSRCNSLEYLDVRSCPHVTKVACDEALNCCKYLTRFQSQVEWHSR
ncbi:putative Beta-1,3-N-Acetylglucosaminyltransferase family protein [Hibiscus syriacus]|uniref:Beta-1,3-N-Acetylglucosaminyltransferase family protein n=1 Tax=Hibiscus syriacus TaxID=106335 RepID=A0A6A2XUZ1_HIBSY|nr:putative Beta-1,3-N-Acetylglucosaminyltransferase family protein [Hibiscus syriacus]